MKLQYSILSFIILLFCFSATAMGQNSEGKVTGRIVDAESGTPLEYATISLFNASDSSLVNGATTDPQGNFTVEAPLGRYYARLQFLSYGDAYEQNINITASSPQVNLGTFELQTDSKTLAEVEVVGEKDQLQFSLDKRVFNVGESMARVGGTASDILDNIPSVTVDVEGNVSLRGSQNVQVLIDGKPSGLVGLSSTEALRSLPADMIERVEVITNPSARYQAEGSAGIINIILKKERRDGVNLALSANTGIPHNHGASVNINYRKNWYNLFANYGVRYYEFQSRGYQNQILLDTLREISSYRNSTRDNVRQGLSHTIRFGSDFFLNDQNTLTAAFLYRSSGSETDALVEYDHFNKNREFELTNIRRTVEVETEPSREIDLNYRRTFDEKGRLLTADFQYRNNSELEAANISDYVVASSEPARIQKTYNREGSQSFLLRMDYTNPFREEGMWEAGFRSDMQTNTNEYRIDEIEGGQWEELDHLTNTFIYSENVHAAYGLVSNKPGRFSYQLGLRAEFSDINSELVQTGDSYPRKYLSFFPTTHFTYELAEEKAVQWSYSRRIRRPRSRWLNPFNTISDPNNIRRGNPFLNPEFTHSLELAYLQHFSKASLTSSIYYRHTDDVMQRITIPLTAEEEAQLNLPPTENDAQRLQTIPMNLATENSYGFEFILSADITKWWSTNTNFNFYRQIVNGGSIPNETIGNLNSDTYTWNARTNMQYKILPGFSGQLTFFYRAPNESPQSLNKALYIMDAGLRKDLFNNKASLSLNVSDVLNSRRFRYENFGETFRTEGEFQWRPRTITLGFTYQLRRTSKKDNERRGNQQNDGGGDEMDF